MLCQHGRQTSFKILCPFTFFVINNSFSLPSSNLPDVIFVLMHCFLIFFVYSSMVLFFYILLSPSSIELGKKVSLKKGLVTMFLTHSCSKFPTGCCHSCHTHPRRLQNFHQYFELHLFAETKHDSFNGKR